MIFEKYLLCADGWGSERPITTYYFGFLKICLPFFIKIIILSASFQKTGGFAVNWWLVYANFPMDWHAKSR